MIGMLGPEDLAIVALIAAVLFGGKKIPELARSLGRAKSEFHKGLKEGDSPQPEAEAPSESNRS
jgi:sec-independent protein translocase protein TatA